MRNFESARLLIVVHCILFRSIVGLQREALMVGLAIVDLISRRAYRFNLGNSIWIVMLYCVCVQCFPLLLTGNGYELLNLSESHNNHCRTFIQPGGVPERCS